MYTIREASRLSGFSAYTLRYYERQCILPPVARDTAGNRMYSDDDIGTLETIRCLKNTGMQVNEIGHFITLCQEGDSTMEARRQMMLRHRGRVEQKIQQMQHELEHIDKKLDYYARACRAGTERPGMQRCRQGAFDSSPCICACGSDGNK